MTDTTPKFRRPPVIETVLGVQFGPLPGFSAPHMGLFWREIRSEYPLQEVHPPLGPISEEFDQRAVLGSPRVGFALVQQPEVRCWFMNSSRTELIQVQRDRLVRNWRQVTGDETYSSYDELRPRFERDWLRFLDFLEREELGRPEVNQCEVTYVNHLPIGAALESFGEAHRTVTLLSAPSQQFLPSPEMIRFTYQYVLPDKKGRLHVEAQPALRGHDGSRVFQLTLTARGRPSSGGTDAILGWLDLGHEWVVNGFADLTTSEMHRLWERYR